MRVNIRSRGPRERFRFEAPHCLEPQCSFSDLLVAQRLGNACMCSNERPVHERAAEGNEPADTLGPAGLTRPASQWRIGANRRVNAAQPGEACSCLCYVMCICEGWRLTSASPCW